MPRPAAAATAAAAGLRLRVVPPRAAVEFDTIVPPGQHGLARFAASLAEAGRHLTGDVRVVVVSGASWNGLPAETTTSADSSASAESTASADTTTSADMTTPGDRVAFDGLSVDGGLEWLSSRPDLFSVAVLRGDVCGFGLDVALACDFRVATDDTSLTWSGVGAGGIPSGAAAWDLVGSVGYARALEWSVVGTTLPSGRAAELGLLTTVVAASAVDGAAESVVEALLAVPRDRAVETKAVLLRGRRLDPNRGR